MHAGILTPHFVSYKTYLPRYDQCIDTACCADCDNAADIVFVVDSSGSIEKERFGTVRDFVKNVIRELDVDNGKVHVGIIYYSDVAELHYPLAESAVAEDVLHAVDTMSFVGNETNTAGALAMMRSHMFNGRLGDRPEVPNYAILITDGVPNIERRKTVQVCETVAYVMISYLILLLLLLEMMS